MVGGGPGVGDDNVPKAETIGLDSEFLRLRDDRETGRGSDMADSGMFRA